MIIYLKREKVYAYKQIKESDKSILNNTCYTTYYCDCHSWLCACLLYTSMPDDEDDIEVFKYAEKLPVALNGYTNLYEYADICYTNMLVDINNAKLYELYKTEGKVLEFY